MNPFARHGIQVLSASSLNLARSNLPLWVLQYLKRVKPRQNLPMIAGLAVEEGVTFGLESPEVPLSDCIERARSAYMRATALSGFDPEARIAKLSEIAGREPEGRKKGYPGMVANALEALRPYGRPSRPEDGQRHRIEIRLDGIPVPIIGYKDFAFDDHGLDVDLKTTGRLPSDMSPEHQLQGAIYRAASGNRAQRFAYVTKSDSVVLELTPEAAEAALETATGIAHCLMRFLSLSDDADELARLTIPDYANYRWDAGTTGAARELWGF